MPNTFAQYTVSACLSLCGFHTIPRWLFPLYFSPVCFWTTIIGNKKDKALSPVQWGSCNRKSKKVHNCEIFLLQGQQSLAAQPDNVLVRTRSHLKQTPLGLYVLDLLPLLPHTHRHTEATDDNVCILNWWLARPATKGGNKTKHLSMDN